MSVNDLLIVTGSGTAIEIYDYNSLLWEGSEDEIDFSDVPYGDYEVCGVGVTEDSVLQIHI
jgi:hypothetical protein